MKLFLYILFFFISSFGITQNKKIDSLLKILKNAKEDTNKVNSLNELGILFKNSNSDTAIVLSRQALNISKKFDWQKGIGTSFGYLGSYERVLGHYDSAHYFLQIGLKIQESIKNLKGVSFCLGAIAVVYTEQGNYTKAIEYALKGIKLDQEVGNKFALANKYSNTGVIYREKGETEKALEYYQKAMALNKELKNKRGLAINLVTIANVYKSMREFDKAYEYCNEAYKLNEEIGDKYGMATSLGAIGSIFSDKGNASVKAGNASLAIKEYFPKALSYSLKLNEMANHLSNKRLIILSLENMAVAYSFMKQFREAEKVLIQALKIAHNIGALEIQENLDKELSEIYETNGNYKLALEHFKNYVIARDTITNEENTKKTVRLEMQFDFDKKEASAKLEQEKKEAISLAESKKQKIIIWSVSGILVLVIGFAVFAYRSFLQKKKANDEIIKQKEIIEIKQKEILDSIHYAKRIQTALLPSQKYIERNLNELLK